MQKPIFAFGAVGGLKAADRRRPGKACASETLAKLIAGMGKMRFMQMAAAIGSEVHRHDPMFREGRVLDRSEDLAGEPDAIMAPANWAKRKLAPIVPGNAIATDQPPPAEFASSPHPPAEQSAFGRSGGGVRKRLEPLGVARRRGHSVGQYRSAASGPISPRMASSRALSLITRLLRPAFRAELDPSDPISRLTTFVGAAHDEARRAIPDAKFSDRSPRFIRRFERHSARCSFLRGCRRRRLARVPQLKFVGLIDINDRRFSLRSRFLALTRIRRNCLAIYFGAATLLLDLLGDLRARNALGREIGEDALVPVDFPTRTAQKHPSHERRDRRLLRPSLFSGSILWLA